MKKPVLIVSIAAVAVVFVVVAGYRVQASMARNAVKSDGSVEKPPSVAVARVEKKDLPLVVSITGVVRAQNESVVFAKMPGRVTKVLVEVGAVVKAGDQLAQLDAANELALRMKQADAQLKLAQAGLENAKLQQGTATSAWTRAQNLQKKGALSVVDFEQAEAGSQVTAVGVQAAAAQVALAEAAVGLAYQAYADTRITAPIAGVVAKRHVDVGSQVSPAQPTFVVQDQGALKMQGTVAASDVARLAKGMPVRVTVDELPGRVLEGTLSQVAPTLEAESRRALVEVSLKPAEGLVPYMFGHAEIGSGERADVLVVPAPAVLPTADGAVVYAVRNGKATLLHPKLGSRVGDQIIVMEGLVDGEQVIVSGDNGIKDGQIVAVAGES